MAKIYVVTWYDYSSWSEHIKFASTNEDKANEYFEKHSNTGFKCGWSLQEWQGEKYEVLKTKII